MGMPPNLMISMGCYQYMPMSGGKMSGMRSVLGDEHVNLGLRVASPQRGHDQHDVTDALDLDDEVFFDVVRQRKTLSTNGAVSDSCDGKKL